MKRPKDEMQESYSEGNMDEASIAYFLRHVENLEAPATVKHKMKVVLMELISNILVHGRSGYGSVSIKHEGNRFVIRTSNFAPFEKINRTIELAGEIRNKSNLRGHYLDKLSEVDHDKQVSLGLIEIFRLSEGQVNITSGVVDEQLAIHFEIKLDDGSGDEKNDPPHHN
jgi:hypothetical protein